jgi:membrane fusion protein (multidrug efflux system)
LTGLALTFPIWDQAQREIELSRARGERAVAQAARDDERRAIGRDVVEAYQNYSTARASAELAAQAVTVARENLRVQEERYRAGATTILDLLTAQVDLADAEAGLVQARHPARPGRSGSDPRKTGVPAGGRDPVMETGRSVRVGAMALLVTGFGLTAFLSACSDAESMEGGPGQGDGPPPMPVEVAVARQDTVVEEILATGEIEAVQSVELRPEVEGRLVRILVNEGAIVASGTPLFKVDDAELEAEVARYKAELDLANQALARTQELLERNASSQADLEQAEATQRSTEAQLRLLQTRLDRTLVRAPFAGVVGERFVSIGDYVTTATPLTTLQTVDPQRASFQVPERHAQRLDVGQRVTFRVAAVPDEAFEGVVDFVDPVVQLPGRMITVKARVPNQRRLLKSGMFIETRLATDVRPEAVVVPEDAILPLQGADYVWVVDGESLASRREVVLGVRIPGFVEVRSGLDPGTQVVVGGLERLSEGARVMPTVVERQAGG